MTQQTTKFKVGDRARMVGEVCEVADPGELVTITEIDSNGDIHIEGPHGGECYSKHWGQQNGHYLEPVERTLHDLQPGDILLDSDDDEFRAIDVLPNSVLLSSYVNKDRAGAWYTPDELNERGFKFKDAPETETTELSVAELEEKLGIEAGTLRVKKD
ncbi:hypothetical protein [Dietzia sp. MNB45]|uniref:hypothetical protein n=1 Tax=Dietzia sp. MNB45 TaxID=3238800 RepID=UPI003F7EEC11